MIALLWLASCLCVVLSYDTMLYGSILRMKIDERAKLVEFRPLYKSETVDLWRRDDPLAEEDRRGQPTNSYYVISNLTQKDSGRYIIRDKDRLPLYVKTINVDAQHMYIERSTGESFSISFHMDPSSCNIYLFPDSTNNPDHGVDIVRYGELWEDSIMFYCEGFRLLKPCGIAHDDLRASCSGRYEIKDENRNKALEVSLVIRPEEDYDMSKIGIGLGIFFAISSCCTCMKTCCFKMSKAKDQTETPDAEPAVEYQEYEAEPAGARPEQSPPPNTLAQPPDSPTDPLIFNPPTSVPPAYSEIFGPPGQAEAPSISVPSYQFEPEPQFELKGMTFVSAPPLSSEQPHDVYESEKLNFL